MGANVPALPIPKRRASFGALLAILSMGFTAGAFVTLRQGEIKTLQLEVQRIDSAKVSKDSLTIVLFEVRGTRATVDSMNRRLHEYFCEGKPRWCR